MELVYKRAGHIELYRYRDSKRFPYVGVVQSLVPSITKNTTELEDGNSDWPYVFGTGMTGNVTINLNSFVPSLYAALMSGSYQTGQTDLTFRKIEEIIVPEESPYVVELEKTPESDGSVIVVNDHNNEWTQGAATTGGYEISVKELTFASADAGTYLVVSYDVEEDGSKSELPASVNDDVFRVTVAGQAVFKDNEGIVKMDNLTFDKMRVEGELAMPSRQREPQGWNFTMRVLKPRPGMPVIDYIVED
jgi:hypothetical protein